MGYIKRRGELKRNEGRFKARGFVFLLYQKRCMTISLSKTLSLLGITFAFFVAEVSGSTERGTIMNDICAWVLYIVGKLTNALITCNYN